VTPKPRPAPPPRDGDEARDRVHERFVEVFAALLQKELDAEDAAAEAQQQKRRSA
jgi:hypothetical protein